MFIAQLDLKKAFDRISHGSIFEMLRLKIFSPQLVAVFCSWWCCSSQEVRLGHVASDRCISVDRGSVRESAGVRDGGRRNSGRFEAVLGEEQLRVDMR